MQTTITKRTISKVKNKLKDDELTAYQALAVGRREVTESIVGRYICVYLNLEDDLRAMTVDDDKTLDVYADGLWLLGDINDRMKRLDHLLERITWD